VRSVVVAASPSLRHVVSNPDGRQVVKFSRILNIKVFLIEVKSCTHACTDANTRWPGPIHPKGLKGGAKERGPEGPCPLMFGIALTRTARSEPLGALGKAVISTKHFSPNSCRLRKKCPCLIQFPHPL
jgi:hypothetical protein